MHEKQTLVRETIDRWIAANLSYSPRISETILIHSARYYGHRFDAGPFSLKWKHGDEYITIYRAGELIERLQLCDTASTQAA